MSSLNQKEFFFFSKSSSHKPCLCRCAVAGCALVEGPMTDAPSAEAAPAPAAEQEAPRTPDAKHRPSSTPGEKRGSCAPCRRAHAGCDGMRPCRRCVSSHQEANCTDQVRCPFYSPASLTLCRCQAQRRLAPRVLHPQYSQLLCAAKVKVAHVRTVSLDLAVTCTAPSIAAVRASAINNLNRLLAP